MNWKYILPVGIILSLGTPLFSTEEKYECEEHSDLGFSLSGDTRTEFQRSKGKYGFDIELNLDLKYKTDRTYCDLKLKFDNDMGVESGTSNHISLSKALIGFKLIEGDLDTLTLEVGRQKLNKVFHSKMQFASLFDGAHVHYGRSTPIGESYLKNGVFIIHDANKKIGSITEIGMDNIAQTGAYTKGSFSYWNQKHQIMQLSIGYKTLMPWVEKAIHLYGAGVMNLKNQAKGYYAGFVLGECNNPGDVSLDVNYQWLQSKTLHEKDVDGLGNNKKGVSAELRYNLTDKVAINHSFKWKECMKKANAHDWQYELELIHTF